MDPVIQFILDSETSRICGEIGNAGPWSRISATRISWVGYELIKKRCRELNKPEPTTTQVREWQRLLGQLKELP